MKRIHIHVNTQHAQFAQSVTFYTTLFEKDPTKTRTGYAKWMLDDPRINFVIEITDRPEDKPGIHHVGLQVDDTATRSHIRDQLKTAAAPLLEIGETECCFSRSEKNWTQDPSGVKWEIFYSFGDIDNYGEKTQTEQMYYTES